MSDEKPDPQFMGSQGLVIESETISPKKGFLLNFYTYEYMGMEAYKYPGDDVPITAADLVPVKEKDGLKVGDRVMVPDPMDSGGYWVGDVKQWEDGTLYASFADGATIASMEFGRDDRSCWVCISFGNTKGLERVEFV